ACRPATSPSPDPVSNCGLPESRARACTITLTRALSDTLPCSAYPVYDAAKDEFLLRLSVASSNPDRVGGPVSVLVGFRGEPRISAYRSSQRGARSVMYAYSSTYLEEWSETAGGPASQGDHTLTITKVGSPYCSSLSKAFASAARISARSVAAAASALTTKARSRATAGKRGTPRLSRKERACERSSSQSSSASSTVSGTSNVRATLGWIWPSTPARRPP